MLRSAYGKWLFDSRRSILGWTIAIAGVGGMYAAFWPFIDNPSMRAALEAYPEVILEAMNFQDVATAAGYLSASVYGLVVGVLVLVYAVGSGARAIAGDEESGTLDLVLAHPIPRRRLALERFGAIATTQALASLGLLTVILVLSQLVGFEGITFPNFLAMHLHLAMFGILYAAAAFAVGAATGRRGIAIGVGAGLGVFGFAADGLLTQVDGLEWIEAYSPFEWLHGGSPLKNGLQWADLLWLGGLTVVFVAVGVWRFRRRDVAV
jgi:ABC-2 type transport system permease protein